MTAGRFRRIESIVLAGALAVGVFLTGPGSVIRAAGDGWQNGNGTSTTATGQAGTDNGQLAKVHDRLSFSVAYSNDGGQSWMTEALRRSTPRSTSRSPPVRTTTSCVSTPRTADGARSRRSGSRRGKDGSKARGGAGKESGPEGW
jgi:hypothetical protein